MCRKALMFSVSGFLLFDELILLLSLDAKYGYVLRPNCLLTRNKNGRNTVYIDLVVGRPFIQSETKWYSMAIAI